MIVAVALLILIGIFGFYLKSQFDKYQASRAADSQPTPQLHLGVLPTGSPSPSPAAVPSPVPSPSPTGVLLALRVDAPTWLQVDVDGKPSAETTGAGRTFPEGSQLTFNGTTSVHVISGKAAHTFITLNGVDQGAMPQGAGGGGVGNKTYAKP
jgi:hypothetical protein